MGIIFNTAAFLGSGLTAMSLRIGFNPMYAFLLGAVLLYIPIKLLLPFGSKKIISETAIIGSAGTIFAFTSMGYAWTAAFMFGVFIGYFYLYWWIFFFPRILK